MINDERIETMNALNLRSYGTWLLDGCIGYKKDYKRAFKYFYRAADHLDDAYSQHKLAVMYRDGLGVDQDYAQAIKWFKISANNGHANARWCLAYMYEDGHGVTKSLDKASDIIRGGDIK